nr:cadherin repeat domain-containing protein [uncultured Allomuricauda sp.]
MKTKVYLKLSLLCLLVLGACSKDDEGINIQDIEVTIEENPSNGQLLATLGKDNTSNYEFTVVTQSVPNAFLLNASNGEIRVNNPDVFDYEANPELSLTVYVTDGVSEDTVTLGVSLNDMDDIFHFLSDSKPAYLSAATGEWISITQDEYNALRESLNEVTVTGAPDNSSNFGAGTGGYYNYFFGTNDFTSVYNIEDEGIPQNGYVFAFKVLWNLYYGWEGNPQVKQADRSPLNGLQDLGGPLPRYDANVSYYVLKGNNTPASRDGIGYIGFYSSFWTAYSQGYGQGNTYMGDGNLYEIIPGETVAETPYLMQYQALTSTQKQWD